MKNNRPGLYPALLLFLFALSNAAAIAYAQQPASNDFGKAKELVQKRDYEAALKTLMEVRKGYGREDVPAQVSNAIGYTYFASGDLDNALRYLEKANRAPNVEDSLKIKILNNLGVLYFTEGKLKSARATFQQSQAMGSRLPAEYILLIDAQMKQNKINEHIRRGVSQRQKAEFDQAVEQYSIALTIDPDNLRARKYRGYAYIRLNQYDKAQEDLNLALKINPGSWDTLINILKVHCLEKDTDSARKFISENLAAIKEHKDKFLKDGELSRFCGKTLVQDIKSALAS